MPKNDSVSRLPMNSAGITTTTPVRMGIMRVLQHMAEQHAQLGQPLARAVRT